METSQKINELLKEHFSSYQFTTEPPALDRFTKARNIVKSYKKSVPDRPDIFMLLASFLNLKIKLYHAVLALLFISAAVLFFNKQPAPLQNGMSSFEQGSSLVAVRNSTVLSCIQTFVSPK